MPHSTFCTNSCIQLGHNDQEKSGNKSGETRRIDEKFSFLSRKINKQKLKNRPVCKEAIKPEKSHCLFEVTPKS